MRWILVLFFVTLANLAPSCMWDRDTLQEEIANFDSEDEATMIVKAIIGAVDRNPTLYYEMRIERVVKELQENPTNLSKYDDIATAYERMNDQESALAWIDLKRQQLEQSPELYNEEELNNHWYRYYANKGTYHAHRWFSEGADFNNTQDLDQAISDLEKGLEFNAEAHFGREKYQLKFLEWAREANSEDHKDIPDFFSNEEDTAIRNENINEAIRGVIGLIHLGSAEESIDLMIPLGRLLSFKNIGYFVEFSNLRIQELAENGHSTLAPQFEDCLSDDPLDCIIWRSNSGLDTNRNFAERKFKALRAYAETYKSSRSDFMMTKLGKGEHPDTHPEFWSDWKKPKMPALHEGILRTFFKSTIGRITLIVFFVIILSLLVKGIGALLQRGWRTRKRIPDSIVDTEHQSQ